MMVRLTLLDLSRQTTAAPSLLDFGKCVENRACARVLICIAAILILSGCLFVGKNPEYPREWKAAVPDRVGVCPSISGTYLADGEIYVESGAICPKSDRPRPIPGEKSRWDCSPDLSRNLGSALFFPATVDIHQPDENQLDFVSLDKGGTILDKQTLHRGDDFTCSSDGIQFSSTSSLLGGPGLTVVGALLLTGGAIGHTRTFFRNGDGELVMVVHSHEAGFHVFIGFAASGTTYVRWSPADAATGWKSP